MQKGSVKHAMQFSSRGPASRVMGALFLSLVLSVPASAVYGDGNPRLQHLYERFTSPCCWQQNLTVHESPIANGLRASIKDMVEEGRTDQQIRDAMVTQYGRRILSLPEGTAQSWLFATPWVIAGTALIGLIEFIRRLGRAQPPAPAAVRPPVPEGEWEEF